ncbi:MAG: ATPase [Acidobacteriota bacterium]|jgi:F-type H+-transporting ATPase subunit c
MKNFKTIFYTMLALALMAIPALAQSEAASGDNESTVAAYKALAAGLGFGLAAGLGGLAQGRVGASAVEGAARNPGAAGTVQTMMIIALALIESLVLLALVIVFAVLR